MERPKSIYYFKNQFKPYVSLAHEIVSLIRLKLFSYDVSLPTSSVGGMWEY